MYVFSFVVLKFYIYIKSYMYDMKEIKLSRGIKGTKWRRYMKGKRKGSEGEYAQHTVYTLIETFKK